MQELLDHLNLLNKLIALAAAEGLLTEELFMSQAQTKKLLAKYSEEE